MVEVLLANSSIGYINVNPTLMATNYPYEQPSFKSQTRTLTEQLQIYLNRPIVERC